MTINKTELGHQVVKDRSVPLTPRQRTALILVDGKKSWEKLASELAAAGVAKGDLTYLVDAGLVVETGAGGDKARLSGSQATDGDSEADSDLSSLAGALGGGDSSDSDRFAKAYPIATRLVGELGFKGFRLNLAVEAASDLDALKDLAPKIRAAAGERKAAELYSALGL